MSVSSAALVMASRELTTEYRNRSQVLCARYAALSCIALVGQGEDPSRATELLGSAVTEIRTYTASPSPGRCVLHCDASCGEANRSAELDLASDLCD